MAGQAAARRRESKRRQEERDAVLGELAAQRQMVAAITQRTECAERARELRAQQEVTAARLNADAGVELRQLTGLLERQPLNLPGTSTSSAELYPPSHHPPFADVVAPPPPQSSHYAPAQPGLFGRRRYARAVTAARADGRPKRTVLANTAIARELAGWCWSRTRLGPPIPGVVVHW